MSNASGDKATDTIEHVAPLDEGCIPIRSIEIVQFLDVEGSEGIAVRWQGTSNVVVEFGMLEYAKTIMTIERFGGDTDEEEDDPGDEESN